MAYLGTYWTVHQLWVLFLRTLLHITLPLSCLVAAEHAKRIAIYAYVKGKQYWTGQRPQDKYPQRQLPRDTSDASLFPRVAVQLPIFNERAVCQTLVDAACRLQWPLSKLHVQVLDDSTDAQTRQLVDDKVLRWREKGVQVEVRRRTNRKGYKAGALKEGLEHLQECKYLVIFDADFRPESDFLFKTVPYLEGNADCSYVQTRWTFANAEESFLTQAQEVALNYHFKCEQFVHFAEGSFFNFNGTAGVWRVEAINDVGGWSSRTTVEDMDLSVRTYVAGWKAIYLDDVTSLSELPSSLYAYRKQQHRWTTGPVQLMTKLMPDIWRSRLHWMRKLELLGSFFFVGKVLTHVLCSLFYCTLLPLSVLTPEVQIPTWALLHVPVLMTVSTCLFTRGGVMFSATYVLFQNAMGLVKLWAVIAGALGLRGANEWVVTTKMGRGKLGVAGRVELEIPACRMYPSELLMSVAILSAAVIGTLNRVHFGTSLFLLLQGVTFVCFGLNMVDCKQVYGGGLLSPLFGGSCFTSQRGAKVAFDPTQGLQIKL